MKFLFDWNGTIADDAARACFATNVALDAVGAPRVDPADFDRKFMLPMDEMFLRLGVCGPDIATATSHWNTAMASRQTTIRRGAAEFLRALHETGEYCAVISAAGEAYLRTELEYFGVTDCFDDVLAGASNKVQALEELRQDGEALYFGDTEYDVASAVAAGCIAVGVLSGYCPEERLQAAGAHFIISGYEGMDGMVARELFGSPGALAYQAKSKVR